MNSYSLGAYSALALAMWLSYSSGRRLGGYIGRWIEAKEDAWLTLSRAEAQMALWRKRQRVLDVAARAVCAGFVLMTVVAALVSGGSGSSALSFSSLPREYFLLKLGINLAFIIVATLGYSTAKFAILYVYKNYLANVIRLRKLADALQAKQKLYGRGMGLGQRLIVPAQPHSRHVPDVPDTLSWSGTDLREVLKKDQQWLPVVPPSDSE